MALYDKVWSEIFRQSPNLEPVAARNTGLAGNADDNGEIGPFA
jgi:hypothetical protein